MIDFLDERMDWSPGLGSTGAPTTVEQKLVAHTSGRYRSSPGGEEDEEKAGKVPCLSSTTDAFRPQAGGADVGEAAHGCGARHASPTAAASLPAKEDLGAGIEPAASRNRFLNGRMDGWTDWFLGRAQERQKRSQKEEGNHGEKKC
nr:unnamed protein product [Digitaria exilis]